jgi:phosphohistidine phosphatase SixA
LKMLFVRAGQVLKGLLGWRLDVREEMAMHKILIALALLLCTGAVVPAAYGDAALYLVRHAEKEADSNPGLTAKGRARAITLAKRLANANIVTVYSTDYRRTRETAEPTARQRGQEIALYDPRKMNDFAEKLKAQAKGATGSILVVGHSNTTPHLASLLTGKEHEMFDETVYNRLYIIRPGTEGEWSSEIEIFEPPK